MCSASTCSYTSTEIMKQHRFKEKWDLPVVSMLSFCSICLSVQFSICHFLLYGKHCSGAQSSLQWNFRSGNGRVDT